MLKINSDILAHLEAGGTLLVPSRQRATAVRLAFTATMLTRGRRVWDSPDVLPWAAWLERELDAAREAGAPVPRRLTSMEEWLLWQEAVHEASANIEIMMPDGLIEPMRRATGLMDDYGLTLRDAPTAEAIALKAARMHFTGRCADLKVVGRASWRELTPFIDSRGKLMLAGFDFVGDTRLHWLEERGARSAPETGQPVGTVRTIVCNDPRHEAQTAAAWCAQRLALDGQSRLLVVVPQLREQRHLWERAFAQRLNPTALLDGIGGSAESNFAIEGGRPLADYRLVATALNLLALGTHSARFEQLSQVLRAPYVAAAYRDQWFALERWLRDHNVGSASLAALAAMTPRIATSLGSAVEAAVTMLLGALQDGIPSGSALPGAWAQAWAKQLEHCGWPGDNLGSDDQQVRMRFDQLLGDFAAVAVPHCLMTRTEAWLRLQSMARRIAFEPATDDVPVTLTSRLEDPVVQYDGIWVAGLAADVWPPPARPDPLLPLTWQRAAGVLEASAEGQARRAGRLLQQWRDAAPECVLSFARNDDDLPKEPSPLLPQPGIDAPAATGASVDGWLQLHAPVLETWEERTRPLPSASAIEGGTRLLELQSLCPFRSFAEFRLKALPLETPQPGVNPRLRGNILHKALEKFWSEASDLSTLQAMSEAERDDVAARSARAAIAEVIAREPSKPSERMLVREQLRTTRMIGRLIEWELKRPPFIAQVLERPLRFRLGGAELEIRRDRVDQLADGRLLILDYKTGAPKKFDALADRLQQPQLPAYAVASGPRAAAVVTLYVGRDGVKAKGLQQDRNVGIQRLPFPKEGELEWPARMARWQQQLESLVTEFVRGEAGLRPQPDACKYCHLHLLCRIDPITLASLDTDPDADEGEEAESESESEDETAG
ncbi:MAG TPA: PD-(D/E)XK nuclease family protein [Steroidobacteraceae bacterium]|nr:PD-(D/E)XK nuclease family protein [Steroidobacteraceae bacterium]